MNNNTTEDIQFPTWIVQGVNWVAEVPNDEYNSQFFPLFQAEEAATRIIEQFKGQNKNIPFKLMDESKTPELGEVVLVFPIGEDPKQTGFLLMVYELLANAGFYKDSWAIQEKQKSELKKSEKPPKKPRKPKK
jgi:hypothetical protein